MLTQISFFTLCDQFRTRKKGDCQDQPGTWKMEEVHKNDGDRQCPQMGGGRMATTPGKSSAWTTNQISTDHH